MKYGRRCWCHHFHHLVSHCVSTKRSNDSLNAEGWKGDKSCLVTTDTRECMTITRPDITTGLPKRADPALCPADVIRRNLPCLEVALAELTLEQHHLRTWVIITEITVVFILGLDVLCVHDASTNLRQHVL
jgi:hypothetical protein